MDVGALRSNDVEEAERRWQVWRGHLGVVEGVEKSFGSGGRCGIVGKW